MKNMDWIISGHNHNILNPKPKSFGHNCRKKDSCPLDGKCLTPNVIYCADVSKEANHHQKLYFGLAETAFKDCYNSHKWDVKHIKYQYNTELTKYIWNLKNNNIKYNMQWKVVIKFMLMLIWQCVSCMIDHGIINHINDDILNKKSEPINKFIHLKKFLTKHVKKKKWILVLCVVIFLYFYSKLRKYVFCLFLGKKDFICLMIAFV